MRRVAAAEVTSQKVSEFTTVLMLENCTKLKTLAAWRRSSRARDSLMVMVLPSDISTLIWPGPSIMLRPASPKDVPLKLTQPAVEVKAGAQNAVVLNHSSVLGLFSETGAPVTFARSEPLTPRLMSTELPSTRGVKYKPLAIVKLPLHCQPFKTCDNAPF